MLCLNAKASRAPVALNKQYDNQLQLPCSQCKCWKATASLLVKRTVRKSAFLGAGKMFQLHLLAM